MGCTHLPHPHKVLYKTVRMSKLDAQLKFSGVANVMGPCPERVQPVSSGTRTDVDVASAGVLR